ncbi:hypothetical protein HPB51_013219 [Rhipicephalus microplus]|uniref:Uncharacterized protein n=1 Tax=Rhipicephalus microplus TaxID=6941 RepID=A0A9J6DMB7_RHIMP|nr:hypothetical protein HPB51_013219 [Rhipicephalus microplus]
MTLIYLDSMAQFSDIDWFTLFCDGISKRQRLRCFKVSTDIGDASYYQQLLTVFKSSRHLKILHFKTIRDAGNGANMAALAAVITRNPKLTLFQVDKFAVPCGHVQLTSVDNHQATDVIQQALRKLKGLEGFMKVTGVVKVSVVCEESSDGRLHLDTLPADCWLAIRTIPECRGCGA